MWHMVMITCVNTQSMGTPQTASGCAVTPEELAGLEAVLQLIRAVIDQVSYSTDVFNGEKSHELSRALSDKCFSKHIEDKIFTSGHCL